MGLAAGRGSAYRRELLAASAIFIVASVAPDIDLVALPFHPPKGAMWGHRGATHSLLAAILIGVLAAWAGRRWSLPALRTAALGFLLASSHLVLDCLNHGSVGVPWLWPVTTLRYGFSWQPIPAVVRVTDFLTWSGVRVLIAETILFAPLFVWALWRRRDRTTPAEEVSPVSASGSSWIGN